MSSSCSWLNLSALVSSDEAQGRGETWAMGVYHISAATLQEAEKQLSRRGEQISNKGGEECAGLVHYS